MTYLLADVGGTNTRIGFADHHGLIKSSITRYKNDEFDSFIEVLTRYLDTQDRVSLSAAVFAVAGPINENYAQLTNRKWTIRQSEIGGQLGFEQTILMNDLQAQGYGLAALPEQFVPQVVPATVERVSGMQLVCGIGTGINIAPVYRFEDRVYVPQSEAGNARLALPAGVLPAAAYPGFVRREDVLSGRGLERLYCALHPENAHKSAADIFADAHVHNCAHSTQTLDRFASVVGHVLGDIALSYLPFGGMYLSGGVARALRPHLARPSFIEAFCDKGTFSEFMKQFPVHIIEDDFAALLGCAYVATTRIGAVAPSSMQ